MNEVVDTNRRPGRFLVTGSANLLDLPGTQESLAGRAETVPLYGLSQGEIGGKREDFVDLLFSGNVDALRARGSSLSRRDYLEIICAGSYPQPRVRAGRRRAAGSTTTWIALTAEMPAMSVGCPTCTRSRRSCA